MKPDRTHTEALRIRMIEDRISVMYNSGDIEGTYHLCHGAELAAVALGRAIGPEDFVFSNHRGHGHFLATGGHTAALINELRGLESGCNGGRGGSQHLRHERFLSAGVQGGLVPVAAGMALVRQSRKESGAVVCCIGDGTLGEGVVFETLQLMSRLSLPMVLWVEDNGIAQTTRAPRYLKALISEMCNGLGIRYIYAGQSAVVSLDHLATKAVRTARGGLPCVFHAKTLRLGPHSKGADTRGEVEQRELLISDKLKAVGSPSMRAKIDAFIDTELETYEPPEQKPPHVPEAIHARLPLEKGRRQDVAVRSCLDALLEAGWWLFGQDIADPAGGAFKVTRGLSNKHGLQVRNFPISEAAMLGMGVGAAFAGQPTIVELMFGDFGTLAADQWTNTAAKIFALHAGPLPLIVRAPVGSGRRYGPTHSQTLSHLWAAPGTRTLCTNSAIPASRVYESAAHTGMPAVVLESKVDYANIEGDVPDRYVLKPRPYGAELESLDHPATCVVVALGPALWRLLGDLDYLRLLGVVPHVFVPMDLFPLRVEFLGTAANKSRYLGLPVVVLEEGNGLTASHFAAKLTEMGAKDVRVHAVPVNDLVPAGGELEDQKCSFAKAFMSLEAQQEVG